MGGCESPHSNGRGITVSVCGISTATSLSSILTHSCFQRALLSNISNRGLDLKKETRTNSVDTRNQATRRIVVSRVTFAIKSSSVLNLVSMRAQYLGFDSSLISVKEATSRKCVLQLPSLNTYISTAGTATIIVVRLLKRAFSYNAVQTLLYFREQRGRFRYI